MLSASLLVRLATTLVFVTLYNDVVTWHPVAVIVSVTCNVPVPAAPQVTVMPGMVAKDVIVPPVTDQLYVRPALAGVLYPTPT